MIIVFEGIDGTGKDTQINEIYKWLRNMQVTNTYLHNYPKQGDTPIQRHLKGMINLSDEELAVEYLREMIKDKDDIKLESERGVVILNRYYYSTIAYQGGKLGIDDMIRDIRKLKLPIPDYVILLDADPKNLINRVKDKDKFESNLTFQKEVREHYLKLAELKPFEAEWFIIDASKNAGDVSKDIKQVIEKILSVNAKSNNSVGPDRSDTL